MYKNRSRILTAATPGDAIQNAVTQWHQDVNQLGDPSQVLLIAHQNQTVTALNTLARQTRQSDEVLHGPSTVASERVYQAGDRVVCLKNRSRLGVLNGDLATITTVDPDHQTLTIRLDRNQKSRTIPSWYLNDGHLDYGYAITGHKAQGTTAQIVHSITTGTTDREWLYVTMSRGQTSNTLHVVEPGHPDDDCTHLPHIRPAGLQALTAELGRHGSQVAAIDSLAR